MVVKIQILPISEHFELQSLPRWFHSFCLMLFTESINAMAAIIPEDMTSVRHCGYEADIGVYQCVVKNENETAAYQYAVSSCDQGSILGHYKKIAAHSCKLHIATPLLKGAISSNGEIDRKYSGGAPGETRRWSAPLHLATHST